MNFFATVFIVFTLFTIINSKPDNLIGPVTDKGNDVIDDKLQEGTNNVPIVGPIAGEVVLMADGAYDKVFKTP